MVASYVARTSYQQLQPLLMQEDVQLAQPAAPSISAVVTTSTTDQLQLPSTCSPWTYVFVCLCMFHASVMYDPHTIPQWQEWVTPPVSIQGSIVTGAEARSGKALKLNVLSGFCQFAQYLNVDSGIAYRMSIWARAVPPTPQAGQAAQPGVSVTLYLRTGGEPYSSYASTSLVVTNTWTQLVVETALVPPSNGQVNVGFFINTGGTGTVWLDDASLTALPTGTPLPNKVLTPLSAPIDKNYFCMNINGMFGTWLNHIYYYGYTWPVVDFGIFRTWDSGVSFEGVLWHLPYGQMQGSKRHNVLRLKCTYSQQAEREGVAARGR